ncbi:phosphotransferase [Solihabitans fulvus]|uniref:Phosphotransferase n=1 Tax=Solihabitans fulvus TaxID=1892852 RepID=A0A5B2XMP5_9PSEU|nr:phosphotransferase [Solihabitans fulvus]KAA2264189.1 phosphotransferase [Solihabitans fulvus]
MTESVAVAGDAAALHAIMPAVLREFPIGARLVELTPAGRGAMGQVWRAVTERGAWAVKVLNDAPDLALLANELGLVARAGTVARSVPLLTSTGEAVLAVERDSGPPQHLRVAAWLDGEHPARPAQVAARVGELLARLHRVRAPYLVDDPRWFEDVPSQASWADLVEAFERVDPRCAEVLRAAVAGLAALGEVRPAPAADLICCHRDLKPANVLVRKDSTELVLLDWENAGAATPSRELAAVLMRWSRWSGEDRDPVAASALHDGYLAGGGTGRVSTLDDFGMFLADAANYLYAVASAELAAAGPPDRALLASLAAQVPEPERLAELVDLVS